MVGLAKAKGSTEEEKKRVLDAHLRGEHWMLVAKHNGVSPSTARRIVTTGRVPQLPRGGARFGRTKVTAEIRAALERYLNENCQYTLMALQQFVLKYFPGILLSIQTISRHLLGMLYTVKQVRIEPATCNNDVNTAPWRNGAVERVNRDILGLMRIMLRETKLKETEWDYLLPVIQAKINQTPVALGLRVCPSWQRNTPPMPVSGT
ncbi:hypothetical protein DYB37_009193 [Aphanomyces astaci]|uniref:Integrase catalytic domain-containing protein n=1 Tax=Aphanomyces astaci TaxID=112090 RepID=A0A3R7AF09_APHAT|nr:hypothetical protein DYB35_006373 [Aphanomyces astaci]RHZ14580.1 hypothetical protein DYB37_009193 [Aphanomyces astaci]